MRIIYLRPTKDADETGNTCVATVDIELNEHVKLYGMRLMRMADGKHILFAPQSGKRRTATFSPALAERLTAMAVEALQVAA